MYKYDNGQIGIDEFGQPVGMKLHAENRWVKKAMIIPWSAILTHEVESDLYKRQVAWRYPEKQQLLH